MFYGQIKKDMANPGVFTQYPLLSIRRLWLIPPLMEPRGDAMDILVRNITIASVDSANVLKKKLPNSLKQISLCHKVTNTHV